MKFYTKLFLLSLLIVSSSFAQQVTGLAGWNIYLDPGHSQKENMGIYNYSEAEKNLGVGLALRDMLLTQTDIDTVYICRTDDQQVVDLSQRSYDANQLGAAWYHSIHSDASSSTSANSTLVLWGQIRQNGVLMEKIPNGGKALSDIIADVLTKGMRSTTRGSIGDLTFYASNSTTPYLSVNRLGNMPTELSEAGFHTNPVQNQRNMNAEYKKLEAQTLFWSILQYKNIPRPKVGICTGTVIDGETGIPVNGATITVNGKSYTTDTYQSLFYKYSTDPNQLHNGFYYIEGLPNDSLQMTVEATGYEAFSTKVFIVDNFFTFRDVTLTPKGIPFVSNSSVAASDSLYPGKDMIVLDFSRQMDKPSVESGLSFSPNAKYTLEWSSSDRRLTIKTDSLKFGTNYTLTIAGTAKDIFNRQLDGNQDGTTGDPYILNFKTKILDIYPPSVVNLYPSANSNNIELIPAINIIFNEPLNTSTISGKVKLLRVSDQSNVTGIVKYYVANGKSVIDFFPGSQLFPNEDYKVTIGSGLEDLFHNAVSSDQSFNFKTGTQAYDVLKIDDFESGIANWLNPQQSTSTVGILSSETSKSLSSSVYNPLSKGYNSMLIKYGFDSKQSSWLISEVLSSGTPQTITFNSSYILQAYILGDGNNNKFRFCVNDSTSFLGHEVSPWFNIDWIGWKLVSWDMTNDGLGSWTGNGKLEGDLRMDSFQFTYTPGSPAIGSYYIDELRVAKKTTLGVEKENNSIPEKFVLEQNYPNPFNPSTTINYKIPENSFVTLKVYDLLGREVSTLVNTIQPAGNYKISFNANNLTTGVYIYKITAGNFSATRKMLLMK